MRRSSSLSRRCTVDWLSPSAFPAAMVLLWRATARKYFRSFQSNMIDYALLPSRPAILRLPDGKPLGYQGIVPFGTDPEADMNSPTAFNPEAFKAATREQWNRSAQGWNDQSARIRDWLAESTEAMLNMADVKAGARVLDVAAGSGDQTLDIARRVGPSGSVLATDLSPQSLSLPGSTRGTQALKTSRRSP
jgi:hypothetical protein